MNIIYIFCVCEGKSYLKQNQQIVSKRNRFLQHLSFLTIFRRLKNYLNNEHSLCGKFNVTMAMTYFSDS